MYVLPDPSACPDCSADTWMSGPYGARTCRMCGFVQPLLTGKQHWLRVQAQYDAEAASGA